MQIKRSIKTNQAALDAEETLAPPVQRSNNESNMHWFHKTEHSKKRIKTKTMATTRAEMKTAKKTSANAAPLGITPKKPCVIKNSRLYKQPRKSFERGTSMKWLLFLLRLSALEILWLVYIYNIVISLLYLYIICIYIYIIVTACV